MTQNEVIEYDERAASDLVDYLGLDVEMNVLMVISNPPENDRDKLLEYPRKPFNMEMKNHPVEQIALIDGYIHLTSSRPMHSIYNPYVSYHYYIITLFSITFVILCSL